jgi:hypothetical protein
MFELAYSRPSSDRGGAPRRVRQVPERAGDDREVAGNRTHRAHLPPHHHRLPRRRDHARGFDYRASSSSATTPRTTRLFVVGDFDHQRRWPHRKTYGSWKAGPPCGDPHRAWRRSAPGRVLWSSPTLPGCGSTGIPSAADLRATAIALVLKEYLFGDTSPLVQTWSPDSCRRGRATYGPGRIPALRSAPPHEGGEGPGAG